MKVSTNFDLREFIPPEIFNKYGGASTWFINKKAIDLAQFYKDFFTKYYKNKLDNVKTVLIVINNWHYGGVKKYSGFRPPTYKKGAKLSQHRFCNAFDCEIIIVFNDGSQQEVDYNDIHAIIKEYEAMFMEKGLTTVESVKLAAGWLHSDCRYIPNQTKLFIIKPKL